MDTGPKFGSTSVGSLDPSLSGSKGLRGSDIKDEIKESTDRLAALYAQTAETATAAYDKTTEALTDAYEQVMAYGRQNPGKVMLMAFGAGAGIGFLLRFSRTPSRDSSYTEPVINAISQFASELFRRR